MVTNYKTTHPHTTSCGLGLRMLEACMGKCPLDPVLACSARRSTVLLAPLFAKCSTLGELVTEGALVKDGVVTPVAGVVFLLESWSNADSSSTA